MLSTACSGCPVFFSVFQWSLQAYSGLCWSQEVSASLQYSLPGSSNLLLSPVFCTSFRRPPVMTSGSNNFCCSMLVSNNLCMFGGDWWFLEISAGLQWSLLIFGDPWLCAVVSVGLPWSRQVSSLSTDLMWFLFVSAGLQWSLVFSSGVCCSPVVAAGLQ